MANKSYHDKFIQLIKMLKSGNQSERKVAITKLVDLTQERLFRFTIYLTANREIAHDIVQDTYLTMLEKIHQLKNPASFQAWLNKLARNKWLDYIKSPRNDPRRHITTYLEKLPGAQNEEKTNERLDIIKIFGLLSPKDREILALIDLEGHSYAEASEIIDISENALKSRLHRARKEFFKYFDETFDGDKSSK